MIRTLGRYELIEQVGTGGMAAVYRGRDTALDREVAVKLLHPHLAARAESRARFSREARAVARLSHPSILEIYDYSGDEAPESYLVTEFVHGRTLRVWQREVGFGFPEVALLVGRELCAALVHAHVAGVIHRDLKPENVLIQEGSHPGIKLADFGIARILASDDRLTMTGALVGSPHHMAPEIVEGREADARSDLFSLGTVLYWLATGALPFAAPNPTAILRRLLEGAYQDPRSVDPRVSDALASLLTRLLAVDPAARPASAAEVRDALDSILAEVGIDRPDQALREYLRDPQGFRDAFPGRALAALRTRAQAALSEGRTARAVALLDRILVISPGDEDALRRLRVLTRRSRRRALLTAAAAAAILGALAFGFARRLPKPSPVSSETPVSAAPARAVAAAPEPAEPEVPPDAGTAPGSEAPRPGSGRLGPPAPAGSPGVRAVRPVPPSPAILAVHVRPYAQRALLDNVEVASGVQVVRFPVSPDHPHLIQIEHPCCFPFVRPITAAEAARIGELRVPLRPRPARLRVEGPAATRVLIDGRLLGTAGESQRTPLDVPLPRGESPYECQVSLELAAPGSPSRRVSIKLKAGADVVVAAPQEDPAP